MTQQGAYDIKVFKVDDILTLLRKETNPDIAKLTAVREWELKDFKITQASWNFMNKSIIAASSDGELALFDFESCRMIILLKRM